MNNLIPLAKLLETHRLKLEGKDERIKELEAQNQWISVKDRLPDELETVLSFAIHNGTAHSIYRSKCFKKVNVVWEHQRVTHWMSLPKPPMEKVNENTL